MQNFDTAKLITVHVRRTNVARKAYTHTNILGTLGTHHRLTSCYIYPLTRFLSVQFFAGSPELKQEKVQRKNTLIFFHPDKPEFLSSGNKVHKNQLYILDVAQIFATFQGLMSH